MSRYQKNPKSKYVGNLGPATQQESEAMHSAALDATIGPADTTRARVNNYLSDHPEHDTMELDSMFCFGKYKNKKTLREVIESNMSYIRWMLDKTERPISEEAYQLIEDIENNPYG